MKKILYAILLTVFSGMFLSGCSRQQKADIELEFSKASNGIQNYIMDTEEHDAVQIPTLQLNKNTETFMIMHDSLASTYIGGDYKIKDNILTAETADGTSAYQFEIIDSKTLKFVQEHSSKIELLDEASGIPVTDGSLFRLESSTDN